MSINANTLYRAIDVDALAKECRDAITRRKVYVVINMESETLDVYSSFLDARREVERLKLTHPDSWFGVNIHTLR